MPSNCILQYNTVRKTTNAIHLRDLVWLEGFPLTTVHYHPYAIHTCIYYLMAEKVIWLDITRVCGRIFTSRRRVKMQHKSALNELRAVGLFLAFDAASTRTDNFTSGKKYRKLVNSAVFIQLIFCFSSGYECIPIRAHITVATQRMPVCLEGYQIRIIEYGKILHSQKFSDLIQFIAKK